MNRGHCVPESASRRRGAYFILFTTFSLFLTLFPAGVQAANYYVRPGGSGDGSSWNSALPDLSSNRSIWSKVGPGDVIYVASGTYSSGWDVGTGGSSGTPLTIRRATEKDHGSGDGWNRSFDGQVVLKSSITLDAPHVVIDGAVENGIKIVVPGRDGAKGIDMFRPHDDITLRFLEIVGPGMNDAHHTRGIDLTPSKGSCRGLRIEYCDIHDITNGIYTVNIDDILIQYSSIRNTNCTGHTHENAWYAVGCDNVTFRWNRVERTTAEGVYLRADTHNWDIYGNLFLNADMGVATKKGYSHSDIRVFNNTFYKVKHSVAFKDPRDKAEVVNNIFYPSDHGVMLAPGVKHDHNWYGGSSAKGEPNGIAANGEDPFRNSGKGDFRLSERSTAAARGKSLGGTFAGDYTGSVRPMGAGWDIGAYEMAESKRAPLNGESIAQDSEGSAELLSPGNGDVVDMQPVMFEWMVSVRRMFPSAFTLVIGTSPELDGPEVKRIRVDPEKVGGVSDDSPSAAAVAGMMGTLLMASAAVGALRLRKVRYVWFARMLAAFGAIAVSLLAGCSSNPVTSDSSNDKVHIEQPVQGLAKGETYYWRVLTTDDHGNETASEIRKFKVQ